MATLTLKELISKNYRGDVEGYEKDLLVIVQARITHIAEEGEKASRIDTPSRIAGSMTATLIEAPDPTPSPETSAPILPDIPAINLDDPNRKLSKEELEAIKHGETEYRDALAFIKDAIAPSMLKVDSTKMQIGDVYVRSFFTYAYPDFLDGNWLSPLINWDVKFDMSIFIYPIESDFVGKYLKNRLTQLYSTRSIHREKGLLNDPALEAQIQDVEELRGALSRGQERYFHFSIYVTIYAETDDELKRIANNFDSLLSGRNILSKQAYLRSEQAFIATGPFARDEVCVYRNISTKGLSTTFPFTSNSLSQDDGILYGINTHNNSLVIFDRFRVENANMVVFAKSGWGKSFAVKLEILRSLMIGTDVIVIDPENEYKALIDTVGGTYININLNSTERINPFDLPHAMKDYDAKPGDLLRGAVVNLIGLMNIMLGKLTPTEEAMLEKAAIITYSLKGITFADDTIKGKEVPIMRDLWSVLETIEGSKSLVERLEKYVTGIFAGIFSEKTNINLGGGLVVFSVRDLDEILRPAAMYITLGYVWNITRSSNKKRILVVDEAWNIMQHDDSAKFLFGLVKRARKYNLGVTTITQDVEDFMANQYGKAIVTNSSIQLLLKQSPASIDVLQNIFKLTDQEKYILLNCAVGQGLFFAGSEHVGMQVLASYFEEKIITTNPNAKK